MHHFEFKSFGHRQEADRLAAFDEEETFSKTRQQIRVNAQGIVDRLLLFSVRTTTIVTSDAADVGE